MTQLETGARAEAADLDALPSPHPLVGVTASCFIGASVSDEPLFSFSIGHPTAPPGLAGDCLMGELRDGEFLALSFLRRCAGIAEASDGLPTIGSAMFVLDF